METPKLKYYCGLNIENLQLIGGGHQGKVYLLDQDRVLKVFKTKDSAKDQQSILQKTCNSSFFPKVYEVDKYSIIMEFIKGQSLDLYLTNLNITQKISFGLVKLIKEFEKLGFTRLDMRLAHIFVQVDQSIKVIDPRKSFQLIQPYPLLMLKGLQRHDAIDDFFNFISSKYNFEYMSWKKQWDAYNID